MISQDIPDPATSDHHVGMGFLTTAVVENDRRANVVYGIRYGVVMRRKSRGIQRSVVNDSHLRLP